MHILYTPVTLRVTFTWPDVTWPPAVICACVAPSHWSLPANRKTTVLPSDDAGPLTATDVSTPAKTVVGVRYTDGGIGGVDGGGDGGDGGGGDGGATGSGGDGGGGDGDGGGGDGLGGFGRRAWYASRTTPGTTEK
jgi:hypothetical protein